MKARVKGTGKIVTIMKNIGYPGDYVASDGRTYHDIRFFGLLKNGE